MRRENHLQRSFDRDRCEMAGHRGQVKTDNKTSPNLLEFEPF